MTLTGPDLDATLAGLVALNDPAAASLTEDWIATPRWCRVVRVLVEHRQRGGHLGDLISAAAVLESAGVEFPRTTAAEALIAVFEAAPGTYVIAYARRRTIELRLRRAAQMLLTISGAQIDMIPQHAARVGSELARIAIAAQGLVMRNEGAGRYMSAVARRTLEQIVREVESGGEAPPRRMRVDVA